jgi:hypothetical protein
LVILLVARKTLKRILVAKLVVAKAAKAAKAIRRSKIANAVGEVRSPKWAADNKDYFRIV